VVNALRKICRALQDTGGAIDDYQDTIQHLTRLETILSDFDKINLKDSNEEFRSLANAINAQAADIGKLIVSFAEEATEKYGKTLGPQAPHGFHRGTWRKVRWATSFSQRDVSRFKVAITERTSAVDLLYKRLLM